MRGNWRRFSCDTRYRCAAVGRRAIGPREYHGSAAMSSIRSARVHRCEVTFCSPTQRAPRNHRLVSMRVPFGAVTAARPVDRRRLRGLDQGSRLKPSAPDRVCAPVQHRRQRPKSRERSLPCHIATSATRCMQRCWRYGRREVNAFPIDSTPAPKVDTGPLVQPDPKGRNHCVVRGARARRADRSRTCGAGCSTRTQSRTRAAPAASPDSW